VGDRHRGVPLKQHEGHRLAQDDATPDHDGALPLDRNLVAIDDLRDSQRSRASESRKVGDQPPQRLWRDAVDILLRAESQKRLVLVEMLGERMLNEHTVHRRIGVQLTDLRDQLFLARLLVDLEGAADHARGFRPLALHSNVGQARRVLSRDENVEARRNALRDQRIHTLFKLGPDFLREGETVENLCSHG